MRAPVRSSSSTCMAGSPTTGAAWPLPLLLADSPSSRGGCISRPPTWPAIRSGRWPSAASPTPPRPRSRVRRWPSARRHTHRATRTWRGPGSPAGAGCSRPPSNSRPSSRSPPASSPAPRTLRRPSTELLAGWLAYRCGPRCGSSRRPRHRHQQRAARAALRPHRPGPARRHGRDPLADRATRPQDLARPADPARVPGRRAAASGRRRGLCNCPAQGIDLVSHPETTQAEAIRVGEAPPEESRRLARRITRRQRGATHEQLPGRRGAPRRPAARRRRSVRFVTAVVDAQASRVGPPISSSPVARWGSRCSPRSPPAGSAMPSTGPGSHCGGDERYLPSGHPDRNETQARAALLDLVPLDRAGACGAGAGPVNGRGRCGPPVWPHPGRARRSGTRPAGLRRPHARRRSGRPRRVALPRSPGPASRPATSSASEARPSPAGAGQPDLPGICGARDVWFLVSGAEKASAVALALSGAGPLQAPAAGVTGTRSTTWLLDGRRQHAPSAYVRLGSP